MRFLEIRGNLLTPISNEESLLLEKVKGSIEPLHQSKLDEREQELARRLVHRGILSRIKVAGENCLFYNQLENI